MVLIGVETGDSLPVPGGEDDWIGARNSGVVEKASQDVRS